MKIFAMADIHGAFGRLAGVAEMMKAADMVVIAGDFASRSARPGEVEEFLSRVEECNKNILAVHGNWDGRGVIELLRSRGYSLHGEGRIIGGAGFFGAGGALPTFLKMPSEYPEDQFDGFLAAGYESVRGAERKVLVCHTPPYGTRDRMFLGLRTGSRSVRDFLEKNRVDLAIVGHIHEAAGVELLGNCLVANSGSFSSGRYLTIELGDKIFVQHGRIR